MRHPPHATDRCCRVCHAINVTAGALPAVPDPNPGATPAERRAALQQARVAKLVAEWLPVTEPDWQHTHYDRARTRTGAGLSQLYESTGERDG